MTESREERAAREELQRAIDGIWECKQQGIYYPQQWRGRLQVDDGYRVQLGILAKHLKLDEVHAGWKVGLTAESIREQVDFHESVFGYLLQSGALDSGAVLTFDELVAPCFETELCLVLGESLKGPGVTPEQARKAIAAVAPAIELVERRGDFAADPALSMADNVQQKYFVTGTPTDPLPPGAKLSAAAVEVYINGELVESASGDAVLGGPEASLAWLANRLADFGHSLEPGLRIMSGSFTRQFAVAQGDMVEARFAPYGTVMLEFV